MTYSIEKGSITFIHKGLKPVAIPASIAQKQGTSNTKPVIHSWSSWPSEEPHTKDTVLRIK